MADSFYADPNAIRTSGSNFAAASDAARRISTNLEDATGGLNPIAGDDIYGRAFSSAVLPSITANSQVLLGVGDNFDKVNVNLGFVADSYTKANAVNEDLAGNVAFEG